MTRSENIGNLAMALAKAQGEMEGAAKDSKNPHFNSRYADLASIVDACRGPLAKHEISYVQVPSTPEAGLVRMTTMLIHSSGEWIESEPLTVQAKDAGPQAVGSCLTYLRRYQLAAIVGIAPEDDDAEAAEGRKAPASTSAIQPGRERENPPARSGGDRPGTSWSKTNQKNYAQPVKATPPPFDPPPLTDKDSPF